MLTIRKVYKADELKRFKELEGKHHYMGKTHSGGETMRLVIEDGCEWVALMVWGSACYRLKPRDEFIGWAPSLRAARQKLVVSNRRFTILAAPGTRKNLASQCLALACRELPKLWLRRFHYRPLLAETFCDIERTAGTCYKAANWIPLGLTKGYTRVNRQERDFFIPNERPKTVWVCPLAKDAVETLNAPTLPATCEAGAHSDADGVLPVSPALGESLYDAMTRVRDTRDDNRSIPSASVLALVVMAMMSGANSVKAIWRFGERLTMAQRKALHFPHDKDRVGKVLKAYYKIPRYETIYKFLRQLDLKDFAAKLSEWLSAQSGLLPRQIAVDGKFIKEVMGVVSAVDVSSGAPVAVAPTSRKEGEKGACELPVARRMLGKMDLSNAIVSGDALHCQDATARTILGGNGEYLLQVKGNQGGVLRAARAVCRGRFPDDVKKVEPSRNRIETRTTAIFGVDPVEVKFVGAHTLVWTHRVVEHLSGPNKGKTSSEDAFHLCSLKRGGYTANAFAKAVRRHWSVEKYHSRRDGAYCEDIRTRRCNHNVMGAMLVARSATFYFFAESGMTNCQEFKERLQANPDEVFRMVTQRTGRKTNDQN